MRFGTMMIGLVALIALAQTSPAAVGTSTYSVVSGGFTPLDQPPPFPSVTVTATVTFDPTLTYTDATSVVFDSSTPALFATLAPRFSYDPSQDILTIGALTSAGVVAGGTNDFSTNVAGASTATPTLINFLYSVENYDRIAQSNVGAVTKTPEPASLGLLAFAPLLLSRRRPG